jgi:hypothetical protein
VVINFEGTVPFLEGYEPAYDHDYHANLNLRKLSIRHLGRAICCSVENAEAGLTVTLGRKECLKYALIRGGLGLKEF